MSCVGPCWVGNLHFNFVWLPSLNELQIGKIPFQLPSCPKPFKRLKCNFKLHYLDNSIFNNAHI